MYPMLLNSCFSPINLSHVNFTFWTFQKNPCHRKISSSLTTLLSKRKEICNWQYPLQMKKNRQNTSALLLQVGDNLCHSSQNLSWTVSDHSITEIIRISIIRRQSFVGSIQKFLAVYTQACPALCDSMDYSPPVSSAHGVFQARILERGAISSSKGSSKPRDWTTSPLSPAMTGRFFILSQLGSPKTILVAQISMIDLY